MQNPNKYNPYTIEQLQHFADELKLAGSSDALMLNKGAMELKDDGYHIRIYRDVEEYREIYLNGIYGPLKDLYNTTCPIVFWNNLYKAMREAGIKAL